MLRAILWAIALALLTTTSLAIAGDLKSEADALTGRVWSLRPAAGSSDPAKYAGAPEAIVRAILDEHQDALG
ncbi:hypothetical protein GF377_05950, partial [candidate division GN15 bacterium]|nr:hypothetical protein [candidate division GN15 bacterium]